MAEHGGDPRRVSFCGVRRQHARREKKGMPAEEPEEESEEEWEEEISDAESDGNKCLLLFKCYVSLRTRGVGR